MEKLLEEAARRSCSSVKSICCSSRGPEFVSQFPLFPAHNQLPVILASIFWPLTGGREYIYTDNFFFLKGPVLEMIFSAFSGSRYKSTGILKSYRTKHLSKSKCWEFCLGLVDYFGPGGPGPNFVCNRGIQGKSTKSLIVFEMEIL